MRSLFLALGMLISISFAAQKWHPFTSKAGAFSAIFPEEPTIKDLTRETPEGYSVTAHLHMMFKEPVTAFVIYNEFETGINIENDSVYLTSVTDEMISKFTEHAPKDAGQTLVKDIVFDGYPGKSFDIDIGDIAGQVKIFLRSNRAYIVAGVFPKKRKADLDKFLNSFKLLPFEPTKFATHEVGNTLKLDLPSAPVFDQESSDEIGDGAQAFATKDPNTGDSYSILITPYSKYT